MADDKTNPERQARSGRVAETRVTLTESKRTTGKSSDRKKPTADDPRLTYKDRAAAAIHESLSDLLALGAIEPVEVHAFEKVGLISIPHYSAERIRALRLREQATQAVFALHLGVSINTVSQWERGERVVTGAAAKLLSLVDKHGLAYLV